MPFNGAGLFTRVYNWVTDKTNGIPITASRVDTEDDGFAAGLSNCLTRDGQGRMTTNFLPGADNTIDLGAGSQRWRNLFLSGTASVPGSITGANFITLSGTTSCANGVLSVVTSVSTGYAVYLVSATITNSNDSTDYNCTALYTTNGNGVAKVTILQSATLMVISTTASGGPTNVCVTQGSGATNNVFWTLTRVG